jgi:hypothetical protein
VLDDLGHNMVDRATTVQWDMTRTNLHACGELGWTQMKSIDPLGIEPDSNREFFAVHLADFTSPVDSLKLSSQHFGVLIAADATGVDVAAISHLAAKLLSLGCVYICTWGPDCSRVHDIFDEESFDIEPGTMTTWHDNESLDEALWFFAFAAFPDDAYAKTCSSALAISIGNSSWEEQIRRRLANLDELNRDIVGEG